MNAKPFVILLVVIFALAGSVGGAFAAGLAVGQSRGEESALSSQTPLSTTNSQSQPTGLGGITPGQLGNLSSDELEQFRQQLRDRLGQGGRQQGGGGFGFAAGGRRGLTGTVEKVEGNVITVNTPQGPLTATIDDRTTIVMFTEGSVADLGIGARVTVGGQRGEDGNVVAQSISVLPEGLGNLAGGFGGRGGQLGGTQ